MGFVLLWIENLGLLLLAVALLTACIGRLRRRWLRRGLWAIAWLILFLPPAILTALWWSMVFQHQTWAIKWFAATLALTISFMVGSFWLRLRGLRLAEKGDSPMPTVAGGWPRGKLAVALAIAVALHLMTIWNLDLAARQQLDTLRVEAGMLGQSVAPQPIPDRDNAAILYEQASKAMGDIKDFPEAFHTWARQRDERPLSKEPPSPELQQALRDWRSVVALMHEAASKPGCYFEHEYHRPTMSMYFSELSNMRFTAGVLGLDCWNKAAKGDNRGAVQDINAELVMARHAATEPVLVAMLVSAGLERCALITLEKLLAGNKVSADDLAALRIEDAPSYRELLKRGSRMEEAFRVMTLYEVGSGQCSFMKLIALSSLTPREDTTPPIVNSAIASIYRLLLLNDEVDAHRRLSQEISKIAEKPYSEAKPLWKDVNDQVLFHAGILPNLLNMPSTALSYEAAARADAKRQAAQLAVAVYLYREKNDHFPEKLQNLVPDFVPFLPVDPYDGKPLRFKRTDGGVVVYSIGPDMTDDGGAPMDLKKQTGDITFELLGYSGDTNRY